MNLLIVDDDPMVRELLDLLLSEAGLGHPQQAESAEHALQLLRIDDPNAPPSDLDLILLDVVLGGMTGIDLCARIKANPRFVDVPIIMVTSVTDISSLHMAFIAGAVDYITKPINSVELLARVRSMLRLKHELDRRKARERMLVELKGQLQHEEGARRRQGSFDSLTGLADRPRFYDRMQWHVQYTPGLALGVILVRLDAFEAYQMHYTPELVNTLVQRASNALRQVTGRLGDVLARYDECTFSILVPHATEDELQVMSEAAVECIARLGIKHGYTPWGATVTASASHAIRPIDQKAVMLLLEEAERGLGAEK